MKLWLADFQRIGAIFVPKGIDHSEKHRMILCGKLIFKDGDAFFVKVRVVDGGQPFITKVCSAADSGAAYGEFCRLMQKREDALEKNTNNICQMVLKRRINVIVWWLFFVAFIVLIGKTITGVLSLGTPSSLVLFGVSLCGFFFLLKMRYQLFRNGFFQAEVIDDEGKKDF